MAGGLIKGVLRALVAYLELRNKTHYHRVVTESRDKQKKFVELAELRVNSAIKSIQLIGNLSNKRKNIMSADITSSMQILCKAYKVCRHYVKS